MRNVVAPRVLSVPESSSSAGREAVELAASAGLELDPWEQFVLEGALGERPDGSWAAFEVGMVVARQNGKGAILEARELAGLFLFGERLIIHSAHLFDTSMNHFLRVLELIENTPEFDRRVQKVSRSHGEEGITLKGGQRLRFKTRTKGGGRGLSGDVVVLDEAMELPASALSALMPTVATRPNPQIWYAGSAVDQMIHQHGAVFAKVRQRGIDGDPRLAFFEWSVDPDVYLADPETVAADPARWAEANPNLGIRISEEYVTDEHRSLDPRSFATERLSVGDWPDLSGQSDMPIGLDDWSALRDASSAPTDPVAFAFDVNPDRSAAAIGVAGRRSDGRVHVELVDHRRGVGWVADRLVELADKWSPCAILVDARGPAASLIPKLADGGLTVTAGAPSGADIVVKTSAGDMAAACGSLFDAVQEGRLRHLGQPHLDGALRAAKTRSLGDAWAWARRSGGDISPLVAVTLAAHGLSLFGSAPSAPTPFVEFV